MNRLLSLFLTAALLIGCTQQKPKQAPKQPATSVEEPAEASAKNPQGSLDTGWLLAVSPDALQFVFYSKLRGRVRILSWDSEAPEAGLSIREIPLRLTWNTPHQAQFSPDGSMLVFDEYGGTGPSAVYISDFERIVGILEGADDLADMAFSPDGAQLAANSSGFLRWEVKSRRLIEGPLPERRFDGPSTAYVPGSNGQLIYWTEGQYQDWPKTLTVRETFSERIRLRQKLTSEKEAAQPVMLDGKTLRLVSLPQAVYGARSVNLSPSASRIGYRSKNTGKLIVIDTLTGKEVGGFTSKAEGTALSQDWWFITDDLIADNDRVYDVSTGKLAFVIIGDSVAIGKEIIEQNEYGEFEIVQRALIVLADGTCSSDPGEVAKSLGSSWKLKTDPTAVFRKLRELFSRAPVGRSSAMVPR